MSLRYLAGFITASYNPLKVPNAPTITTVTAGDTQLTVDFTAPSNVGGGAITSYIAIAKTSAGVVTSTTGSSSPITITGLTNGVAYNVQVAAVNAYGPSAYSAPTSGTPVSYTLYGWGYNGQGQVGDNTITNRFSPTQIGSNSWASISNASHTLAVMSNGTLWAWGSNSWGQLGQNDTVNRSSPVQIGALTTWSKVSASDSAFSIGLKTDGTLWAWGYNSDGQLGQNNRIALSSPVQIGSLTTWANVTCGLSGACAIKTDGTIWSWGNNAYGKLGLNDTTYRSSPVQVGTLTNWSKIACGSYHTMAIKTDGTMWGWGNNYGGQLGQNNQILYSSPVQVGALTNWNLVSGGQYFTIATKTDGTLWSWGNNVYGQLGLSIASSVYKSSPTQIGALTTWLTPASIYASAFCVKTDGTLWSWGRNNFGQLGVSGAYNRSSPVQVGALTTWVSLATGATSNTQHATSS